jgi:hypothetical protein
MRRRPDIQPVPQFIAGRKIADDAGNGVPGIRDGDIERMVRPMPGVFAPGCAGQVQVFRPIGESGPGGMEKDKPFSRAHEFKNGAFCVGSPFPVPARKIRPVAGDDIVSLELSYVTLGRVINDIDDEPAAVFEDFLKRRCGLLPGVIVLSAQDQDAQPIPASSVKPRMEECQAAQNPEDGSGERPA